MSVVLARPDLVRSLILMDTTAWSFIPPDEGMRELVHGFIDAFDPAQGMPATLNMNGPEDDLIEARTSEEWQQEKDAIFAGMDAYAVKGLGTELMGSDADDGSGSCADGSPPSPARPPSSSASTTTRWSTRRPRWPPRWRTAG